MSEEEEDYMSDAILNQCVDNRPGLLPKAVTKRYEKEKQQKKSQLQSQTKPRFSVNNMSEEEDYMSDAILNQCVDNRPGLLPKAVTKRYEKEKQQKKSQLQNQTKPRQVLEAEKREEGLNKSLTSDNKGFAIMSKMGYKPGMAIGKKGDGRKEPVGIEMPHGRAGLGHVAEKRKRQEQVAEMMAQMIAKRKKFTQMSQNDFRKFHSNRHAEKRMEKDLAASQRVCAQLDQEQGDTEPCEWFFWPETQVKEDQEEEEDEDEEEEVVDTITTAEKLELLTKYLRGDYLYCVWCGTRYDDENDMSANCPGNTAEDHDD